MEQDLETDMGPWYLNGTPSTGYFWIKDSGQAKRQNRPIGTKPPGIVPFALTPWKPPSTYSSPAKSHWTAGKEAVSYGMKFLVMPLPLTHTPSFLVNHPTKPSTCQPGLYFTDPPSMGSGLADVKHSMKTTPTPHRNTNAKVTLKTL